MYVCIYVCMYDYQYRSGVILVHASQQEWMMSTIMEWYCGTSKIVSAVSGITKP